MDVPLIETVDGEILELQRGAYVAALRQVAQRATVIRQVALELCQNRSAVGGGGGGLWDAHLPASLPVLPVV